MEYLVFADGEEIKFNNIKKPINLLHTLIRKIVKFNEYNKVDIYTLVNKPIIFKCVSTNKITNYIYSIVPKKETDAENCKYYDFKYRIEIFKQLCIF